MLIPTVVFARPMGFEENAENPQVVINSSLYLIERGETQVFLPAESASQPIKALFVVEIVRLFELRGFAGVSIKLGGRTTNETNEVWGFTQKYWSYSLYTNDCYDPDVIQNVVAVAINNSYCSQVATT